MSNVSSSRNSTSFGLDWSCVSDLDPRGATVTGFRIIGEAIARRLQTPRGGLLDDPNYGYDLVGELNDDMGAGDTGRIAASVTAECLKDQRVTAATVTVTFVTSGVLTVTILL